MLLLLSCRDALNNAINGSHDIHIGKLLAQEDVMREQSIAKISEVRLGRGSMLKYYS